MITLISTIIGFLTSIVPNVVSIYKQKQDYAQELAIMQLQIEQQRLGYTHQLEEIAIKQDVEQVKEIYKTYYSGVHWIDGFNGLIRPLLTISFFGLYVTIKILQYHTLQDAPLSVVLDTLWGIEDQSIFASVIAFYFGNRTFAKLRGM